MARAASTKIELTELNEQEFDRIPETEETEILLREGEYIGYNGEIISRALQLNGNQYEIPEELIDPRFVFQWCRHDCYGNIAQSDLPLMRRGGWREVKEGPIFDFFKDMSIDKDVIIIEGALLMVRPKELNDLVAKEYRTLSDNKYALSVNRTADQSSEGYQEFIPFNIRKLAYQQRRRMNVDRMDDMPSSVVIDNINTPKPGNWTRTSA